MDLLPTGSWFQVEQQLKDGGSVQTQVGVDYAWDNMWKSWPSDGSGYVSFICRSNSHWICIYIYEYYIYIYIYIYIYTCVIYIDEYMYIYIYIHMYICIWVIYLYICYQYVSVMCTNKGTFGKLCFVQSKIVSWMSIKNCI